MLKSCQTTLVNTNSDIGAVFKLMFSGPVTDKFCLGKTKASYVVNFDLSPYFHAILMKGLSEIPVTICFDEALNKVVQQGQMDITGRYFDNDKNQVESRYITSVFLGRATADDLQTF